MIDNFFFFSLEESFYNSSPIINVWCTIYVLIFKLWVVGANLEAIKEITNIGKFKTSLLISLSFEHRNSTTPTGMTQGS